MFLKKEFGLFFTLSRGGSAMRIAMLSPHYDKISRGTEKFVYEVSTRLKKRGHEVDIISSSYNGVEIDSTSIGGGMRKVIGIEPNLSHLSYFFELADSIKKKYDILWNNAEIFGALFCHKMKKRNGTPWISTFHGNKSMLMINTALLKPNMLAVLTPDYKNFLRNISGNIKCIPNGVDLERFNPLIKKLSNVFEYPVFLSTSALIPSKRVDMIIRAISKINKGSFVFTSTGSEKDKLLSMAEERLKGRYFYLGRVEDQYMPDVYSSCNVYVSASRAEGHSLALLEAMACNKPIVAHDCQNSVWTIGEGGCVVNTNDIDKFACELMRTSEYAWGDKPRKQAENFSWEKTVDLYEKEMEEILLI